MTVTTNGPPIIFLRIFKENKFIRGFLTKNDCDSLTLSQRFSKKTEIVMGSICCHAVKKNGSDIGPGLGNSDSRARGKPGTREIPYLEDLRCKNGDKILSFRVSS